MTRHLAIENHLGLKLDALLDLPAGPGPYALVILLHGNTGWKEEEHIASLAQGLASAGIAALRFDASGSGQSDGSFAEHYRPSNYLADVGAVYAYALANLDIAPERVGIWGHSYGGMIAIYAAAAQPPRFRAVCGSQPSPGQMSELKDQKKIVEWQTTGWQEFQTSHFGVIKLPYAFYEERSQYRTATAVQNIHQPLLLITGTKDTLVSADSVRTVYAAANQPKQLLEFPAGHDYKRQPELLGPINRATIDFFTANLS